MTCSGAVFVPKPFASSIQIQMLIHVIGEDGKGAITWGRPINRGVVEIPRTTDQELLGQPGRPMVFHSSPGPGLPGTQAAGGNGKRLGTGVHGRTHGRLLVRAD